MQQIEACKYCILNDILNIPKEKFQDRVKEYTKGRKIL